MFKCLSPISVGMTAVFEVNVQKLEFFLKQSGVPVEDWSEIYDLVIELHQIYQQNSKAAGVSQEEIEALVRGEM